MAVDRIAETFAQLRQEGNRGLVVYLTAGDPSPDRTVELMHALDAGGGDLIELGVPFSDPTADGPVIQRASERALKAGTTLPRVLEILREFREQSSTPVILFSYLNPVLRYGFKRFAEDAAAAGADGALLTDLNIEAAGPYCDEMSRRGLHTVFLVSQTTGEDRLRRVAERSGGFLYLVSAAGVTGMRDSVSEQAVPLLQRARAATDLPLAIGFGLSKPKHMEAIAPYADAAVVGSAFMRTIEEHQGASDLGKRLEAQAAELKGGLKTPAGSRV